MPGTLEASLWKHKGRPAGVAQPAVAGISALVVSSCFCVVLSRIHVFFPQTCFDAGAGSAADSNNDAKDSLLWQKLMSKQNV